MLPPGVPEEYEDEGELEELDELEELEELVLAAEGCTPRLGVATHHLPRRPCPFAWPAAVSPAK